MAHMTKNIRAHTVAWPERGYIHLL